MDIIINSKEKAEQKRLEYLEKCDVGLPKPTEFCSLELLQKIGYVGLYEKDVIPTVEKPVTASEKCKLLITFKKRG